MTNVRPRRGGRRALPGAALAVTAIVMWSPLHGAGAPTRKVAFAIVPAGARVVVDAEPVAWFGTTVDLPIGSHTLLVDTPRSACCRPSSSIVRVLPPPSGSPNDVQWIHVDLEPLPAVVALDDAPAGAELACEPLHATIAAGNASIVRVPGPVWSGWCDLRSPHGPAGHMTVEIRAGEVTRVGWP